LEFTWNDWRYTVWLKPSEEQIYVGHYEARKGSEVIRSNAACYLTQVEGGLDLKGIFKEGGFDHEWYCRLDEMTAE
jgi:hypothetical protein